MAKYKRHLDEELRKKGAERFEKGKSFEEKTAEVLKLMGFEVELNKERETAGNEIDIFLKLFQPDELAARKDVTIWRQCEEASSAATR